MKLFFILGFLAVSAYAVTQEVYNAEAIIKTVNSAKTTWKAGHNFAKDTPLRYIKNLLGFRRDSNGPQLPIKSHENVSSSDIPKYFDARKKWPNCPTISHIRDQGVCGSCWAVAAASAFSDRLCIATEGIFTQPLSEEELLSCCVDCGYHPYGGCVGGYAPAAWNYFKSHGIVTGGDYKSNVGCQPYQIQPCEHRVEGKRPQCSALPSVPIPDCKKDCINPLFKGDFQADHRKVKSSYAVRNKEADIQMEILKNGPVEAAFTMYEDFPVYKSGVYQHVTGGAMGGHCVRIIGWGEEEGTPYWLIANSWNTDWGDNGVFKFLRGSNECEMEDQIFAGEPDV